MNGKFYMNILQLLSVLWRKNFIDDDAKKYKNYLTALQCSQTDNKLVASSHLNQQY